MELRAIKKLKDDVRSAQRMYYLYQKLEDRVPEYIGLFCKNTVNRYIKLAKEIDLKLTSKELYERILDE